MEKVSNRTFPLSSFYCLSSLPSSSSSDETTKIPKTKQVLAIKATTTDYDTHQFVANNIECLLLVRLFDLKSNQVSLFSEQIFYQYQIIESANICDTICLPSGRIRKRRRKCLFQLPLSSPAINNNTDKNNFCQFCKIKSTRNLLLINNYQCSYQLLQRHFFHNHQYDYYPLSVILLPSIIIELSSIFVIIVVQPIKNSKTTIVPIGTSANLLIELERQRQMRFVSLLLVSYLNKLFQNICANNKSLWKFCYTICNRCSNDDKHDTNVSGIIHHHQFLPPAMSVINMNMQKSIQIESEQINIDEGGNTIANEWHIPIDSTVTNNHHQHNHHTKSLVTKSSSSCQPTQCRQKQHKVCCCLNSTSANSSTYTFSTQLNSYRKIFSNLVRLSLLFLLMTSCLVASVITLPTHNVNSTTGTINSIAALSSSPSQLQSESQQLLTSSSISSSPRLISAAISTVSVVQSPEALSQHSAENDDKELSYYLKPSQFFNRYFSCRYTLKQSDSFSSSLSSSSENRPITDDVTDGDDNDENLLDSSYDSDLESPSTQALSTLMLSEIGKRSMLLIKNGSMRHSKRQRNVASTGSRSHCPVDCDGISRWPETEPNTVQMIPCLDVLESIRQKPPAIPNHEVIDDDGNHAFNDAENSHKHNQQEQHGQEMLSIQDGKFSQKTKIATSRRRASQIDSIESYAHNGEKHSNTMASRRCSSEGSWQSQADYSTCGLESTRLFVLDQHQLRKIYDIREKMVNSKYTKTYRSELEFIRCVDNVLSKPPSQLPEPFCERTFDGWTCFNDTPAGHITYFKCPDFIYGFNSQNEAHKTCTIEGKWKVHRDTLQPWTNYTSCVDIPDFHFRNMIINLHIIGYSISLVALLISLTIFFAFKTLSSQTRIRIHKNFFVSFIINNFMWIIWYFAITDQNMLFENSLYCQALHVILHYFLVCNYFWMFCEGLYLHTILVVAFVSEEKILKWFYLIGWGIPAVFAACYAILRANSPDAHNCWIEESKYTWILNVPVCISFFLNIIFLINIVRVLVTKLQAVNTADTHQTRKAVRATLILIPLLGLHFILTPFRPENNSSAAHAYEVFSAIVSSLQGFCVSMLFCFFNGEVLTHIRKRWDQFLLVHGYGSNRRMSYGGTTVSCCLFSFVSEPRRSNQASQAKPNTTTAASNANGYKSRMLNANQTKHNQIDSIRDKGNFLGSIFRNSLSYCLPCCFNSIPVPTTAGGASDESFTENDSQCQRRNSRQYVQGKHCCCLSGNDNREEDFDYDDGSNNNNGQTSEHLSLCMADSENRNQNRNDNEEDEEDEHQSIIVGLNNIINDDSNSNGSHSNNNSISINKTQMLME